jgi:hypothetical protein
VDGWFIILARVAEYSILHVRTAVQVASLIFCLFQIGNTVVYLDVDLPAS